MECTRDGAVQSDERIGHRNLNAGAGYGGSCFPKDVIGLVATARKGGVDAPVIEAIDPSNSSQRQRMVSKLAELIGPFADKSVCLLGLSFKPDTDDILFVDNSIVGFHESLARPTLVNPQTHTHPHRQTP